MSSVGRTGTKVPNYVQHPGSTWIDEHRSELPDNQWVAATASGKVATDPTIDGLMSKIQSQQLDPDDVAIAFVTPDSA